MKYLKNSLIRRKFTEIPTFVGLRVGTSKNASASKSLVISFIISLVFLLTVTNKVSILFCFEDFTFVNYKLFFTVTQIIFYGNTKQWSSRLIVTVNVDKYHTGCLLKFLLWYFVSSNLRITNSTQVASFFVSRFESRPFLKSNSYPQ